MPTKPMVHLSYEATYRLFFLELKKVATAEIKATEGRWHNRVTGLRVPVCLIEFKIDSLDHPDSGKQRRFSFHNSVVSVMTLPDLETVLYIKRDDEHIRPWFKKAEKVKRLEIFDMESGQMDYYREDLLSGDVQTQLVGGENILKQNKKMVSLADILSKIYRGEKTYADLHALTPIQIDVGQTSVMYDVVTKKEKSPMRVMGEKRSSLRMHFRPSKGTETKGCEFTLWACSFIDLVKRIDNETLKSIADEALEFTMTPLVLDAHLSLGVIRCRLNTVYTEAWSQNRNFNVEIR
ncbi:MAG: hypothetical protein GKR87_00320 [Kiritimatiellae bacterium]|nr:hypothetical protein [Kiritimatiellia bacterium]